MGVFGGKKMVLTKYPKILTGANLRFRYDVSPISLYFLKVPRLWQTKQSMGFCRQETWFLWNNRRFWKVLKLGFGYDVGPISWYSLKKPKISTSHTGNVGPIRCKPNFFVLFKNPRILTRKSRLWIFGVKKHGSYEIRQNFNRSFTWNFDTFFENPKILTNTKIGHEFLASKT